MKFSLRWFLILAVVVGVVIGLLGSFVTTQRRKIRIITCINEMRQLTYAILNYESAYTKFPASSRSGTDRQPWHSWRTDVLRFMESHPPIYEENEPWDSTSNKQVLHIPYAAKRFQCCADDQLDRSSLVTSYVVVSGPTTMFPPGKSVTYAEITDGPENTILLVESLNTGILWTEPRDLDFDTMSFKVNDRHGPSISSKHPGGAHVTFADGSFRFMTEDISEAELKALLTIAGGEDVTQAALVERGILK